MAYVVIVCPKCRLARGAHEGARTTRCARCGRSLPLRKLRKYLRTGSLTELAEAVGRVNARLRGGLETYLDELAKEASGRTRGRGRTSTGGNESPQRELRGTDAVRPLPPTGVDEPGARGAARRGPMVERRVLDFLRRAGPSSPEEVAKALGGRLSLESVERVLERLRESGALYEPRRGRYTLVL